MTGYLYQARYALLCGLREGKTNPSYALSIETFDDVTFEDHGKAVELIQTKHHGEPRVISDSSVDLWNTITVWLDLDLPDLSAAPKRRFVLLTTDRAATASALAKLRNSPHRDVPGALKLLVKAAHTSQNQVTASARAAFLSRTLAERELLLDNVWIFDSAPDIANVRHELQRELHYVAPPGTIDVFTDYVEGWWFRRVIAALTGRSARAITLSDLHAKVTDIRQDFTTDRLPLDEELDSMPLSSDHPLDDRMFIRQMHLVSLSRSAIRWAVHDYYRAFTQRSRWARESLLLDGETEKYDRALTDAWYRQFLSHCDDRCPTMSGQREAKPRPRTLSVGSRVSAAPSQSGGTLVVRRIISDSRRSPRTGVASRL